MSQSSAAPVTYSTWITGGDVPLIAHVHVPAGRRARGAVVLCPPVAKEHVDTYRGLVFTADRLAERGVLAVRFDYAGVGDSAGDQTSPTLVAQWLSSVRRVIAYAAGLGVGNPVVAGLRVGALLAGVVAGEDGVEVSGLVLWDPVISASRYVRGQQALYRIGTGSDRSESGFVHIVGADLAPAASQHLAALAINGPERLPGSVFLAVRRSDLASKVTIDLASRLGVDPVALDQQEDFVNPPGYVGKIPLASALTVVEWISRRFSPDSAAVTVEVESRVVVDGVIESIERLGADGLFSIRTDPVVARPDNRLIVFNATSNEHRIGPARLWVESARAAARVGHSAVRFDRRGTGDSGLVVAHEMTAVYDGPTRMDVVNVVNAVGKPASQLIMAGICSGAWTAAYGAGKASTAGAIIVNNSVWTMRPRKLTRARLEELNRRVTSEDQSGAARVRARAAVRRMLPYFVWTALGRRGHVQVPEVMLAHLLKRGVVPRVILCPDDSRSFYRQRGAESLDRLAKRGTQLSVLAPEMGDHAAYSFEFRQLVLDEVIATADRLL